MGRRHLRCIEIECNLSNQQLQEIWKDAGLEKATYQQTLKYKTILGLDALLNTLETMNETDAAIRAKILREAFCDLYEYRKSSAFETSYVWSYHTEKKKAQFEAHFVRTLRRRQWIPNSLDHLSTPEEVIFETIGWQPHHDLESKIGFRRTEYVQLAQKMGFTPDLLYELRKFGIKNIPTLRKGLKVRTENKPKVGDTRSTMNYGINELGTIQGHSHHSLNYDGHQQSSRTTFGQFISYIRVKPDKQDTDPDHLEYEDKMWLEDQAIHLILKCESGWQRTPPNNPEFDLYRGPTLHTVTDWCKVEPMTRTFTDRPVAISQAQFKWAWKKGKNFWLYVVEKAETDTPKIVRIQNLAHRARNFTFDEGERNADSDD
ncbi:MAG: hypothetical protein OXC62_10230 [Aestuariivita sp.]|nr:hypothetical protein [Aestuariivita sp.]